MMPVLFRPPPLAGNKQGLNLFSHSHCTFLDTHHTKHMHPTCQTELSLHQDCCIYMFTLCGLQCTIQRCLMAAHRWATQCLCLHDRSQDARASLPAYPHPLDSQPQQAASREPRRPSPPPPLPQDSHRHSEQTAKTSSQSSQAQPQPPLTKTKVPGQTSRQSPNPTLLAKQKSSPVAFPARPLCGGSTPAPQPPPRPLFYPWALGVIFGKKDPFFSKRVWGFGKGSGG